jgi:hypothetical protein
MAGMGRKAARAELARMSWRWQRSWPCITRELSVDYPLGKKVFILPIRDRVRYNVKLNYLRLQAAAVRRPPLPEGTAP